MDKLILYKKFPEHISKIKTIHHKGTIYYELIIDRNYEANDTIVFETNPYKCFQCNIELNKYTKMLNLCKRGLLKYVNEYICDKIIKNIKEKWTSKVHIESDTIGNETLWFFHLCYKCFDKKKNKKKLKIND